jgi:two-component system, response regulator PdtaR
MRWSKPPPRRLIFCAPVIEIDRACNVIAQPSAGEAERDVTGTSSGMPHAQRLEGRVLIVEDEYVQALQNETTLKDAGLTVVGIANSVLEAVAVAKAERPDFVLMDIHLIGPREGIDAAMAIFWATGIRCIFATAHADPRTRALAAPAQPLGWVEKPYPPAQLLAVATRGLAELKRRSQ